MSEKEISRKGSATNLADEEDTGKCAGCKRNCKAFTQREWVYIILIFTGFYLFMTGWMAIHISAMVSILPDRNTWEHNGCKLGDARNRRFYVDSLTVAKNDFPDCHKNLANATLIADPWNAGDTGALKDREIACPYTRTTDLTTSRSCAPKQQLRVVNQYENRILKENLEARCKLTNWEDFAGDNRQGITSIDFKNFVDPRSLGDPSMYPGRRVAGDCATAEDGQGCTYDSTLHFERAWENNVPNYTTADLLAGEEVSITWFRGYASPIIVDFEIEVVVATTFNYDPYSQHEDKYEFEFKCRTTNKVDETFFFGRGGDPLAKPINGEREIEFDYTYYFCPHQEFYEDGTPYYLNPACADLDGYDCTPDISESYLQPWGAP